MFWLLLSSTHSTNTVSLTVPPSPAGLRWDIARTADPNKPKGYSTLYHVCSVIKAKRKGEERGSFVIYISCLLEQPLCMLKPCFLGIRCAACSWEVDIKTFGFPLFPHPTFAFSLSSCLYLDPWGPFSIFFFLPRAWRGEWQSGFMGTSQGQPTRGIYRGKRAPLWISMNSLLWISTGLRLVITACAIPPTASVPKDNFQRGNFPLSIYSQRKMQRDFLLVSGKTTLQSST